VKTYALPAVDLARKALAPTMRGVAIGVVWTHGSSGAADVVGIALQRDGRLALTIRESGEPVQRWIALDVEGWPMNPIDVA